MRQVEEHTSGIWVPGKDGREQSAFPSTDVDDGS